MATPVIDCRDLSKRYGKSDVFALKQLTLHVNAGEVYGFLDPNGAGKSTAIRTLLNFIQPTSGTATIAGFDIVKDSVAIKQRIGYLAGDIALYPKATGAELLDYLFALQGADGSAYRRTLEKRFEADLTRPINSLSKGNRQKIGIIQAFMHQPDVLILDEPTSGLDPLMQEAFHETVNEARDRGAAILMSSHNLTEAQRISDRVGIIKHGKLIHEQAITGATDLGKPVFRVVLVNTAQLTKLKKAAHLKFLSKESGATGLFQATGKLSDALKTLSAYDIQELTTQQLSLEDEFLEFYGEIK